MTIRGANLGCGRLVFPVAKGDSYAEHVAYALDQMCPEAYDEGVQWDNFDKIVSDSIVSRLRGTSSLKPLDLFKYPWPIEDNTYDVVWLSHIAEHIPHKPELSTAGFVSNGKSMAEEMYFNEFDGWFIFFGECWRILKPGGRLCVLAPYGASTGGISDPTHTRYLSPGSFGYFAPSDDAPFDYALPYRFAQIPENGTVLKFIGESSDIINKRDEMAAEYDAIKGEGDRYDAERAYLMKQIVTLMEYLGGYSSRHFNQISEFIFAFRPVGK